MLRIWCLTFALAGISVALSAAALAQTKPDTAAPPAKETRDDNEKERARIARWEGQIRMFEEQDVQNPPPKDAVLFVGSSSIRLWKLADSFPNMKTINRGFGGSQLADSVHYADRLITKHQPRVVVLYAGDNDLGGGKSPEQVAADFAAFVAAVHAKLPETKIVYIGIKPSIARWKLIDKVRDANRRIQDISKQKERVVFIDVEPPMLDATGMPRGELFVKDGLHMSPAGYAVWTELLVPHLQP